MSEEQKPPGPSGSGPTYHQEVQHTPVTARVPDRVGMGVFSTGTIVMHGPHDFVIDFLQSLASPKRIAARVILPPSVVPLFLAAMQDNFSKYTQTFGPIPRMPQLNQGAANPSRAGDPPGSPAPSQAGRRGRPDDEPSSDEPISDEPSGDETEELQTAADEEESEPSWDPHADDDDDDDDDVEEDEEDDAEEPPPFPLSHPSPAHAGAAPSRGPQPGHEPPPISEVYDQLKLPDDMLSGSYANTVVITHSGAEFCFDFITSFFPRSAVAARVYMACPHVLELFESLSRSWEQFRQRGRHA